MPERVILMTLLTLSSDNSAYRMQDEKHQKRQSAKNFAEDSTMKSLFNTLFMMFNSRYRGATVHRVTPPTSQRRIGRMYYILKERSIIKHFAGFQEVLS
jgi:hypothetical protein